MTEYDRLKRTCIALDKENQRLTETLAELHSDYLQLQAKQTTLAPRKIDMTDSAYQFSCTHRCNNCNVGLIHFDIQPTNYCGYCGQKLREVDNE